MKIRFLLSSVALALFAMMGGGSVDEDGSLSAWVWIVIIGFVVIFVIAAIQGIVHEDEERERSNAELERKKQQEAEKKSAYDTWFQTYSVQHGVPDKSIIIEANEIEGCIHIHESKKEIFLKGQTYPFKDIMSCTFSDNPTIIKGAVTAVTKSKNGSAIGRAIVGDVIAGPAGAIIGGTTGKNTTEFKHENDRVIHNYTVLVNVNSIANPLVRIETREDGELTNEIVALMNVIMARN